MVRVNSGSDPLLLKWLGAPKLLLILKNSSLGGCPGFCRYQLRSSSTPLLAVQLRETVSPTATAFDAGDWVTDGLAPESGGKTKFKYTSENSEVLFYVYKHQNIKTQSLTYYNNTEMVIKVTLDFSPWSPNSSVVSRGVSNTIIMINLTVRETAHTFLSGSS